MKVKQLNPKLKIWTTWKIILKQYETRAVLKKTLDLGVARYMGKYAPRSKFMRQFYGLFLKHVNIDTETGHFTRNFDWDGYRIYTPCDCQLAVNEWFVNSGEHKNHIVGKNTGYATMFALRCGLGVIFGNGSNLFLHNMGKIQNIFFPHDKLPIDISNLKVSEAGDTIITISQKSGNLSLLVITLNITLSDIDRSIHQSIVPIDKQILNFTEYTPYASWKIKLLEDMELKGTHVCLYASGNNNALDINNDILLINYKTHEVIFHGKYSGLQCISKHPNKEELAVLGKELSVLSLIDFTPINSTALPMGRKKSDKGVISYSSCGRYIALSYAVNGEIEIRSSEDLRVLQVFRGHGIPQSDISWDITGRFLACRFKNRERGDYKIFVWNCEEGAEVLKTNSSCTEFIEETFKWHPSATKIACLVDQQRIQVFELV